VTMEEIARVLTPHPPSDRRPPAPPAQMTAQRDLLSVPAETLASRPIVTCASDDTVTQAARRMRDRLVSSLVVDSRPPGLVTATDLRDRVLAAGLDPDTPVRQVMTTPLQTIQPTAPSARWCSPWSTGASTTCP
jgi:signal-transduction protein with cAMP-binding, CBS, and nucleotidyltransferase domain